MKGKRGRPRIEIQYSEVFKNRIKRLYLKGFTFNEMADRTKVPRGSICVIMYRVKFIDSDFEFAQKELDRANDRYDKLVDYSLPLEKFLNKKSVRLRNLLRKHGKLQVYGDKDVIARIRKVYSSWKK